MKYITLIISIFLLTSISSQAQTKTESFLVYGNCGMCKRIIEKSAMSVEGVESAEWDSETDIIKVSIKDDLASVDAIKESIAAAGYDSETHRAAEEVYSNLHFCCQYDRPEALMETGEAKTANTASFTVYGNCGMCQRRIEGALSEVKGIHSASWDAETKMLTVLYEKDIVTQDDMQKRIAAVGHDTGKYRAEDEVYSNLHGCCQYDRN